jgi:cation transport regulator ChaB
MSRLGRRKELFAPRKDGTFRINLGKNDREFLADLPNQIRAVIEAGDEQLTRRLFPAAYHRPEDAEHEIEFRKYMREELITSKMAAMAVLAETAHDDVLTEEQMMAWMGSLNDVRLVLGTQLDVHEGMDFDDFDEQDPNLPAFAAYHWLSLLVGAVVYRLSGSPKDDDMADDLAVEPDLEPEPMDDPVQPPDSDGRDSQKPGMTLDELLADIQSDIDGTGPGNS